MTIRPHHQQEIYVCSMCLENIEQGQPTLEHKVTTATSEIFHKFHENCLRSFLETPEGTFCPICKVDASAFGAEFQRPQEESLHEEVFLIQQMALWMLLRSK